MDQISVRPVITKADNLAFLRMPYQIYEDDPVWVAPPWQDHIHYFDVHHNAELQVVDQQKFVAWDGDTAVGTIIAHVHRYYNEYNHVQIGWFGQFETINRQEVAHALLQTAEGWVRDQGMTSLMGPATYSTNSEVGLLIEGHQHPQMFLTTYAKPYYKDLIESYPGISKAMDLWSWIFDVQDQPFHESARKLAERTIQRRKYRVYTPQMKHFEEEVAKIKYIFENSWTENWGFVPFTEAMFDQLTAELKQLADPRVVVMVETQDGKPIGFGIPLPNILQAVHAANLKPQGFYPWQMAKLLWHWKVRGVVTSARIALMGVLPEYRGTGVDVLLLAGMYDACQKYGYKKIEMSWMLETNDKMNRIVDRFNAQRYKTHRLYELPLDPLSSASEG